MPQGRQAITAVRIPVLACALGAVLFAWIAAPVAGDEEVAQFLLGQAKKAISMRQFDEAIQKLERARAEDPKLVEASYLLGQVFEKTKEPGKALGAYRACRDAGAALGEELDRKAAGLVKKAEKRIQVLGKGEAEFDKAQDAFAKELTAFATRMQGEDPDIAIDALRRVLAVAPAHKPAADLLAHLTGVDDLTDASGDVDPMVSPIPGVTEWRDMLKTRDIPPSGEKSYSRRVLTLDQEDGSVFWTGGPTKAPETFVYDMEFRFVKEHARGYLLGFAFARDETAERRQGGNEFVTAFAQKTLVNLVQATGGKNNDVAETAIDPLAMGTWHRLTVAVEGRKVRLLLDGKKLLTSSIPGRKSLDGPVGLFHQRCVCEIRVLRLGTKP